MTFAEDLLRQAGICPRCGAELSHEANCEHCGSAICPICGECPLPNCQDLAKKMRQEAEDQQLMEEAMQEADRQAEIDFDKSEFYREQRGDDGDDIPFTSEESAEIDELADEYEATQAEWVELLDENCDEQDWEK